MHHARIARIARVHCYQVRKLQDNTLQFDHQGLSCTTFQIDQRLIKSKLATAEKCGNVSPRFMRGQKLMTFASIHNFFENKCPDGAGFAIHSSFLEKLVGDIIDRLSVSAGENTNIGLQQSKTIRFSFLFDSAAFKLNSKLQLSSILKIWLHGDNNPGTPIVTLMYEIQDISLEPFFDASTKKFAWKAQSASAIHLIKEEWNADDSALTNSGYVKQDGTADKQRFLDEIYFGFKWVNSQNLLSSIMSNLPFPQVHTWIMPFILSFPFNFDLDSDYLLVSTDEVKPIFHMCDIITGNSEIITPSWQLRKGSPSPESPYDKTSPPFAVYIAAKNLVSWQFTKLSPAVHFGDEGGAFIKWSYDCSIAMKSFALDLIPSPLGGALEVNSDLRLAGQSSAWIEGPSGTRLNAISVSLTGNGHAAIEASVGYDPKSYSIKFNTETRGDIDKGSLDFGGGGYLGIIAQIVGDIVELLFKSGIVSVDLAYNQRSEMHLLDLRKSFPGRSTKPIQRIGNRSALISFQLDDG